MGKEREYGRREEIGRAKRREVRKERGREVRSVRLSLVWGVICLDHGYASW